VACLAGYASEESERLTRLIFVVPAHGYLLLVIVSTRAWEQAWLDSRLK
jgi:hypothetical protein